jgi:hypothetical protein
MIKIIFHVTIWLFLTINALISCAWAECVEFQIIEHGDTVEAVCVGKPLTAEEQKIKQEEEKREQQKNIAEQSSRRKLENDRVSEEARAAEARRPPPKAPEKPNSRLEKARQQNLR